MPHFHHLSVALLLSLVLLCSCATKSAPSTHSSFPPETSAAITLDPALNAHPQYPLDMRTTGQEGKVVLLVTITSEGTIASIRVKSSTGDSFTKAAIESVRSWKFAPNIEDGKFVPKLLEIPFVFRLIQ